MSEQRSGGDSVTPQNENLGGEQSSPSAEAGESQEWTYLLSRLELGDNDERVAAANSMRLAHGMPVVGHGLTHSFYCTLRALKASGVGA